MTFLPFAEWRPDVSDLSGRHTQMLRGVVPRDDGYGPWQALQAFTAALGTACRGYFFARRGTGEIAIFAGTSDRLWLLDNTTLAWDDVSLGGGAYTQLDVGAHWQFAQFGNFVFATQRNAVLQRFDLISSIAFANAPGSPPQAGAVAVVNRFLVLADLLSNPFRMQWCGINDTTQWTPGVGLSDFQDMPDGGRVRRVADMSQDVGLILQEGLLRRMAFIPSAPDIAFAIDRFPEEVGIAASYSLATAAGFAFFLSTKGFAKVSLDGGIEYIGEEKIDRTFLGATPNAPAALGALAYDSGSPHLVIGAADPRNNRVVWAYKSVGGSADQFDKGLVYHWTRKRWAPIDVSGEYLAQMVRPGLTLEALDAIAPGAQAITACANNGAGLIRVTVGSTAGWTTGDFKTISGVVGTTEANGNWTITVINGTQIDLQGSAFVNAYVSGGVVGGDLDALPFSLDSISTASLPGLSAFDSAHKLGFFTGDTIEARLETAEQRAEGQRANINGMFPRTDAPTVFGFISKRDNLNAAPTDTAESEMLAEDGFVPLLEEARNGRGCIRIPAALAWSYASGVELDTGEAGEW